MAKHQHEPNANELWLYFQNVINLVQVVFPNYRKEMKGIEWGFYYNEYKNVNYNSKKLEEKIVELMGGDQSYIELFARTTAPGWASWGNEVDKYE